MASGRLRLLCRFGSITGHGGDTAQLSQFEVSTNPTPAGLAVCACVVVPEGDREKCKALLMCHEEGKARLKIMSKNAIRNVCIYKREGANVQDGENNGTTCRRRLGTERRKVRELPHVVHSLSKPLEQLCRKTKYCRASPPFFSVSVSPDSIARSYSPNVLRRPPLQ